MLDLQILEIEQISARSSIEEAVKSVIWSKTQDQIHKNMSLPVDERHRKLKEVVNEGTRARCYIASKDVIYNLAQTNTDFFQTMILISTKDIEDGSWLKKDFVQEPKDLFHTYFLIKDNNGVWYAGSPANQNHNDEPNYANTLVISEKLDDLLKRISERDNARFPSSGSILEIVDNNDHSLPKISNWEMNIVEIIQNVDKTELINHIYTV